MDSKKDKREKKVSLAGQQLGRYRLIRLIGSGGMGEVYLAEDLGLNRQVAIKVIRAESTALPGADVAKATALFQREARAVAMLDHPYILPLYDYGEQNQVGMTLTYLVMPYRQEGSLANWLQQRGVANPLSFQEIEHIVQQAAGALQYAHDRQLIHQDVKPSNFLIRMNKDHPNRPDVLLTDFGIAKLSTLTSGASQNVRGTPNYMAPEQWEGHSTPASDQYALAVMAYELLTGRSPFQGNPLQMMYAHVNTQPPVASSINPRLPAAVDVVLSHGLAKRPEQRFASISAFARALQQALQESDSATFVRSSGPDSATFVKTPPTPSATDLYATLAISEAEARTGTNRPLTLPDGQRVTVFIPAGAHTGQVINVGEVGNPTVGGAGGLFYVKLSVVPPVPEGNAAAFSQSEQTTVSGSNAATIISGREGGSGSGSGSTTTRPTIPSRNEGSMTPFLAAPITPIMLSNSNMMPNQTTSPTHAAPVDSAISFSSLPTRSDPPLLPPSPVPPMLERHRRSFRGRVILLVIVFFFILGSAGLLYYFGGLNANSANTHINTTTTPQTTSNATKPVQANITPGAHNTVTATTTKIASTPTALPSPSATSSGNPSPVASPTPTTRPTPTFTPTPTPTSAPPPTLTASPPSFIANNDCGYGANHGWLCSMTLGEQHATSSLNWSASSNDSAVSFSPASGTVPPGQTTHVEVFVGNVVCPTTIKLLFSTSLNSITVPWQCGASLITASPATLSSSSCTVVTGGWQCTVTVGEDSNSQGGVAWSTSSSGIPGITFNPSNGSIFSPSAGPQTVTVFIPNTTCPASASLIFSSPGNTVTIPWSC